MTTSPDEPKPHVGAESTAPQRPPISYRLVHGRYAKRGPLTGFTRSSSEKRASAADTADVTTAFSAEVMPASVAMSVPPLLAV